MRPLVVLVEFLVKPSFLALFRDLIAANRKALLEREALQSVSTSSSVQRSRGASFSSKSTRNGAAFDEHLASSHYLSFADAIEGEIEQRSISRLAFISAMATSEENFK
jgi:quinol monooxygenase YgiN